MLDPIAERMPSYHFMLRVHSNIQPDKLWGRRELIARIACLFAASTMNLISCLTYLAATIVTSIIAPLKLPFTLLHLIFDENKFLNDVYKIPGFTDGVIRFALKTALFALTSGFASLLGLISPHAMLKTHSALGLITLP